MKVARIYMRVSTDGQDLTRQERLVDEAKKNGLYVAGVYREKASGARSDRPELLRMIHDLQTGDVVIAEKIDRISRLPLPEAQKLISSIKAKGAMLSIPGIVDMSELVADSTGTAKIVLESLQELLLKLSLQMARDEYESRRDRQLQGIELARASGKYRGRKENKERNELILKLRQHHTIKETARLAGCSESQVKRICKING